MADEEFNALYYIECRDETNRFNIALRLQNVESATMPRCSARQGLVALLDYAQKCGLHKITSTPRLNEMDPPGAAE